MRSNAAVLVADRTFELRAMPVPDPQPGGALMRVEGCGMCGSDIEQYHGVLTRVGVTSYPVIPGHEAVGRIGAIDAESSARRGLKEGDRVAILGMAPCGVCHGCR